MRLPNINNYGLTNCYIAGGSVLSTVTKTEVVDYDIYPKSDVFSVCAELLDNGLFVVGITDRAVTFKDNTDLNKDGQRMIYQVIRGEFPTSKDIFKSFDFTVCMGAFDCDTSQYQFHEDFWVDATSKTLRFNPETKWPVASLLRVNKYAKRGYQIGKGEMTKVALAVAKEGTPESWEELEKSIGGFYGKTLKIQSEGLEFSFGNAISVLSDFELNTGYEEVSVPNIDFDDLEFILSSDTLDLYEFNGVLYTLNNYWLKRFSSSVDLLRYGVKVNKTPLKNIPYIWGMKRLVKNPDNGYIGCSHRGNHNGVTYESGKVTSWDETPYLHAYLGKEDYAYGKGTHHSAVIIPTEDIVNIDYSKIQTKSMTCVNIQPN